MQLEKRKVLTVLSGGRELRDTYLSALAAVNLEILVIHAGTPYLKWLLAYKASPGILLVGGLDIDPAAYRQKALPTTDPPDRERYLIESQIVNLALKDKKPLLGICLGSQTINVALGGDLQQSIPGHQTNPPKYSRLNEITHEINLRPGSHLCKAYNTDGTLKRRVNSMHHQAVKTTSNLLKVSAVAQDGIIEAIEAPIYLHPWLVGVQFHPEADPKLWSIFGLFAQAVRAYSDLRESR